MKCAVALVLLLCGRSVLLGDTPSPTSQPRQPPALLGELVRMTRSGSSSATVLAYARAHRMELPPEVSNAQLRWLRDSGVAESVVRYMAAIDVRISGETVPEGVTHGSSSFDDEDRPRAPYRSTADDDQYAGDAPDRSVESYAGGSGYAGNALNYGSDYDYNNDFGYGYYPFFGDPFPYSAFPAFFFVDRANSFRRFPRRDHRDQRDHRDHGFDGGHRGRAGDRGEFREAWRDRGFRGRSGSMAAGIRGSGRPAFARGLGPGLRTSEPGPRGRSFAQRGFRTPGPARAGLPSRFRGAPGAAFGHRDFGRGGFPSGPPAGRGFGRGQVGGGRGLAGSSGGRGRH